MASSTQGPSLSERPSQDRKYARPAQDEDFDLLFPIAVGLGRRILDREGRDLQRSVATAEELAVNVFVDLPRPLRQDEKTFSKMCAEMADVCLEALLGDQTVVSVPLGLLPPETGFLGELPLRELQATLSEMRRSDRRVGLLVFAAGLSPAQAASALGVSLDRALSSINRIGKRFHDRQVLGLGPKFKATHS
ncbi:MAG: hypothetical protein F2942_06505 [Actinobacteria bacterium]|uniref:Unannotated protein n=1 Tax=freshwater metagenome TaxID=449393 RepID=A0A6J7UME0_9ZZZZ|nr:hypothetical protein [Actinomycetota bacterium]